MFLSPEGCSYYLRIHCFTKTIVRPVRLWKETDFTQYQRRALLAWSGCTVMHCLWNSSRILRISHWQFTFPRLQGRQYPDLTSSYRFEPAWNAEDSSKSVISMFSRLNLHQTCLGHPPIIYFKKANVSSECPSFSTPT